MQVPAMSLRLSEVHCDICRTHSIAARLCHIEIPSGQLELRELGAQPLLIDAASEQRAKRHVARDAGEAIEVRDPHRYRSSSGMRQSKSRRRSDSGWERALAT